MGSQARLGTSKPSRNVNVIFSTKTKPYSLNPRYNFSVSSDTYRITESKVVLFFLFFQRVGQKIKNTGFAFFSFFIFFIFWKLYAFWVWIFWPQIVPESKNSFGKKVLEQKVSESKAVLFFFIFAKGVPKNPNYWILAILANFWRHWLAFFSFFSIIFVCWYSESFMLTEYGFDLKEFIQAREIA